MPEQDERQKLAKKIRRWNDSREDLLEISQPDENLEFQGVMRFYYEDLAEGNTASTCLRVSSKSTTREIIGTLSEKFRPDLKILSAAYSLYEVQAKKERRLDQNEKPLIVQLNWTSENKDGRFLLRKHSQRSQENCYEKDKGGLMQSFKRTLSRKDKKTEKNKSEGADNVSRDKGRSTGEPRNKDVCTSNSQTRHFENQKLQIPAAVETVELPLEIRFNDSSEEAFLSAVINYTNSSTVHFKLSPAYILYAVVRFTLQRPLPRGQLHGVCLTVDIMVAMTRKVIQRQPTVASALTFWMANSSELLNFLKQDKDLCQLTQQSQQDLTHLVHKAYSFLLQCLQNELKKHLPTFLIDPEEQGPLPAGIEKVLNTLMNTMALFRRCQVNHALTIQLFSQIFHFISTWLFNHLMSSEVDAQNLRSHYWGVTLRERISVIEGWAERQGLELVAQCHLGHIVQATTLLTMSKSLMRDAKDVQATCFKLNSLQLQTLLAGYFYANNEPLITPALIDAIVAAAEASADRLIRSEGQTIQLEESLDLHLPFLLPEGGYSCDTVRGIPAGFREFLEPICRKGLCSVTSQTNTRGKWTVFFKKAVPSADSSYLTVNRDPEIVTVTLRKPLNSGMGVSIVAAKGAQQDNLGIYIKSILNGGPAEMNGGLTAGDQLLSVDGQSLVGLTQERAAAIMLQTGPVVNLQVAKFAARYHSLEALLSGHESDRIMGDEGKTKTNGCRQKKEQKLQKNRQLYRSNPNVTNPGLENGDEPVHCRENITSVSTVNLCADFPRDYLTLPSIKSKDMNPSQVSPPQQQFVPLRPSNERSYYKMNFMRHARSQEDLYMDSGRPLVDQKRNIWQQGSRIASPTTMNNYSSFPIRSCVSTLDVCNNVTSPKTKESRTRGAGVWKTPFSQHPTPTPSTQPLRIDIPITRAQTVRSNPPLTTFQTPSSQTVKMNINGYTESHQIQAEHLYGKKLHPSSLLSMNKGQNISRGQVVKPQVSITPTKHVSFQEPPTQQKMVTLPMRQKQEVCRPWRRATQEEMDKQVEPLEVKTLEKEVQELQAKMKRSEEKDRLQKLSLEWRFQKKIKEVQQRRDDDKDRELGMMVIIQQLGTKAQEGRRSETMRSSVEKHEQQSGNCVSCKDDETEPGQMAAVQAKDINNIQSNRNQEEKIGVMAPEMLTFKEHQRLFSLASTA